MLVAENIGSPVVIVIAPNYDYNRTMRAPETVRTERLTGHRVRDTDLPYIRQVDSDIRVQKTLFGRVQTEEQSRDRLGRWTKMWEERGFGFWIFTDATGAAVGHGGVFSSPREAGEIEVGYVILPAFWGQGLATEITRASLSVGFEQLEMQRIIGIAQSTNAASRHVMEKCGMIFEVQRPSPDGIDGVRYAIARAVWLKDPAGMAAAKRSEAREK